MLYVICGNDREKGRVRFGALRGKFFKEIGSEEIVGEGMATDGFLDASVASQGLFSGVTLFVFDGVLEKKAEQEILVAHGLALVESSNIFLVFESSLEKDVIGKLKVFGAKVEECAMQKTGTKPAFNIFSLGDALGKRNKKELWLLYQGACKEGLSPEEICGTLFWAVKNIALMKHAKPGDDAGLNPFVAKKSRGFAANYTEQEIVDLSRTLVTIYHEAHRGGEPLEIALERCVMRL